MTEDLVRVNELLRRKQEEIEAKTANEDYLKDTITSLEREKQSQQTEAGKVPEL
jgi:hypothetical protein